MNTCFAVLHAVTETVNGIMKEEFALDLVFSDLKEIFRRHQAA
ncbi:MAG TPA: hypothetical protein PL048_26040 [Leptospiraceae bacterium]|nr:hypothetical protein [Leptospiraceae bacterium]